MVELPKAQFTPRGPNRFLWFPFSKNAIAIDLSPPGPHRHTRWGTRGPGLHPSHPSSPTATWLCLQGQQNFPALHLCAFYLSWYHSTSSSSIVIVVREGFKNVFAESIRPFAPPLSRCGFLLAEFYGFGGYPPFFRKILLTIGILGNGIWIVQRVVWGWITLFPIDGWIKSEKLKRWKSKQGLYFSLSLSLSLLSKTL